MKKIFSSHNLSILISTLTILIFSLSILESAFYLGFVQKHFFISFNLFLILYFLFAILLFRFKQVSISPKLNKLNSYSFLPLLLFYFLLIFLEEYNYPNFIYGHLHLNPANFIYIPLVSSIILFVYNNKKFQKIFYFLLPLIATYLSQFLTFGNNFDFQKFSTVKSIITNYFLWFLVLLLSTSLFKKKNNSLIFYLSFFSAINFINLYKIKYLNVFFSLNDIKLIKNLKSFILPIIRENILKKELIISIILFILLIIIIKKNYTQKNPPFKVRFLFLIIPIFIFIIPIYFPDQYKSFINKSPIKLDIANPINNCKNNGILFCFIDDFKNLRFPIPSGYNQPTINNIYSNLKPENLISEKLKSNKLDNKVNVVIILSEALWDATKLPQTKYSQDPIKNIRSDIKSTLISPVYGGSTANVEFEILTGLSNYFLNDRYPYNQLINQDMPSLFSLFKEQGYLTTAIHPFKKSMYNRPIVYQHFGVDKFTAMEDMSSYEIAGSYISDKSFTQEIVNQFESTNQPQFIFALSMQNHMPYIANSFSNHQITIESPLIEGNQSTLQTYIDGINLSNQSYKTLKETLQKSSKPTIVIFYGDHLPYLNNDFSVYKKLGFIPQNQSNWSTSDYQNMYTTPISVWANFKTNLNINSSLSPNFLSLEILKLANINPKYQFSFLQTLSQTDTVLNKHLIPKFSTQQLNDYELIQYDIMIGKQYGIK